MKLFAAHHKPPASFAIPLYALGRKLRTSSGGTITQQNDIKPLVKGIEERRSNTLIQIGPSKD